jgi:hypothetical protein
LSFSPGLQDCAGESLHEVWKNTILASAESNTFHYGYWDEQIKTLPKSAMKKYLMERYVEFVN